MVSASSNSTRIAHMVEFADVLHSENIDAVCMRYVEDAEIPRGDFDNVSRARYGTPTHWDMGKVYKRLALGIVRERACEPADAIAEAFCSPVAPLIDDFPLYSVEILTEYDEVLRWPKFPFTEGRVRKLIDMVQGFGVAVDP